MLKMKAVSSRYTAAVAVAVIAGCILTSQYGTHAFAPAMMKGRESNTFISLTLSPAAPAVTDKSTILTTTTSKNTQNPTKKRVNKRKKPVNVKNAPKRKNTKKDWRKKSSKKNAPKKKNTRTASEEKNTKVVNVKMMNNKSFKPLKDLTLGSDISGTVVDVCDFGVFVNIGYATRGSRAGTALIHISQLSDKKIKNIHDTIKVGDTIEGARVINVDLKKGEAGLSLRSRRPKRRDYTDFTVGSEVEGRVDSVVSYGVFVDVGANVNALLHVSRITGGAIENVRHHLNEGDRVSVHVIDVGVKEKKMAVSMLDKKADQYLDRRMTQRLKKYYNSTPKSSNNAKKAEKKEGSKDLEYFDIAIRELEEALKDRE
eukprot:CAMPEP_0201629300 /NCGR_PEP_ID=MMETSP0493-20130528/4012_1 /ASSEMBLY_ACC=CAM_ASM_000838 /TAXON_ID=420259 /ORGANISM="Thalassiosira gravida, Strain GMp14c1" /LENGTH=370 /DNA_ID=CAMNT_0048100273 /DNA_START=143 /DNA_END=1258 /DNA_ORIENTATION=+